MTMKMINIPLEFLLLVVQKEAPVLDQKYPITRLLRTLMYSRVCLE